MTQAGQRHWRSYMRARPPHPIVPPEAFCKPGPITVYAPNGQVLRVIQPGTTRPRYRRGIVDPRGTARW